MLDERRAIWGHFRIVAFTAVALLAALAPNEAGAQFFHLQGFLECIDHPETEACQERLRPVPRNPAPAAARPPTHPAVPSASTGDVPKEGPSTAKPVVVTKPAAVADGGIPPKSVARPPKEAPAARFTAADLKQAIARIQANRATGSDMAVLEAKAHEDDPAAVEVLAWCKLYGRGVVPDRVAAYRLYGRAVALDVPHARENQRVIFERLMTDTEKALAADARAGT